MYIGNRHIHFFLCIAHGVKLDIDESLQFIRTHRGTVRVSGPRVSADYSLLNSLFDSLFKLFLGAGFS